VLASGVFVANLVRENCRAVWEEVAKLTEEKEMPPEETSGTPERVSRAALQVMRDWMSVTTSATSAGRAVLPMMKQALACRGEREEAGAGGCQLCFVGRGEEQGALPPSTTLAPRNNGMKDFILSLL